VHNARAAHHGHETAGTTTTFTSGIAVPTATTALLHETHDTATAYKPQQQHSARGRGGVFFGASTVVQPLPEVNGFSNAFTTADSSISAALVSDAYRVRI
jgi:hypothetical protein